MGPSKEYGEKSVLNLIESTKNKKVTYIVACNDATNSIKSSMSMVESIEEQFPQINVLVIINNTTTTTSIVENGMLSRAIMGGTGKPTTNEDGLEVNFMADYMVPYILSN